MINVFKFLKIVSNTDLNGNLKTGEFKIATKSAEYIDMIHIRLGKKHILNVIDVGRGQQIKGYLLYSKFLHFVANKY